MISQNYQRVPKSGEEFLIQDQIEETRQLRKSCLTVTVLLLSLIFNVALLYQILWRQPSRDLASETSHFAELPRNFQSSFEFHKDFVSLNRSISDPVWQGTPSMDISTGFVALDDDFAATKGLWKAQRWPWDSKKGIYLLDGFHKLHCVQVLRQTIFEFYDGKEPQYQHHHLLHCLDQLRDSVMCDADDTPRYTGRLHGQEQVVSPSSGLGQPRKCRDWKKLVQWAQDNSACYQVPTLHDPPEMNEIDRYKFCPDGRVFWSDN